mmetsp:Transcript_19399/g.58548  ORF Transcript_19399/g.58548 Transcript_19399/m.58548 type:complete len:295 (+) Transcript_19399:140-1024(+)
MCLTRGKGFAGGSKEGERLRCCGAMALQTGRLRIHEPLPFCSHAVCYLPLKGLRRNCAGLPACIACSRGLREASLPHPPLPHPPAWSTCHMGRPHLRTAWLSHLPCCQQQTRSSGVVSGQNGQGRDGVHTPRAYTGYTRSCLLIGLCCPITTRTPAARAQSLRCSLQNRRHGPHLTDPQRCSLCAPRTAPSAPHSPPTPPSWTYAHGSMLRASPHATRQRGRAHRAIAAGVSLYTTSRLRVCEQVERTSSARRRGCARRRALSAKRRARGTWAQARKLAVRGAALRPHLRRPTS